MEEFLIMGEFTHSWNHVGEFSAKRVTTSSFAGTTKPILLGKKKKIIILLIPQNLASAAESFVFPSSSCLGYISCLPPLPDVGPHVKITQGTTLESPQSQWSLPSGCPQLSSATFTQPAVCRPRGAGRALLLLLLLLQMLTTVPPPVVGSACRGSMLSLT